MNCSLVLVFSYWNRDRLSVGQDCSGVDICGGSFGVRTQECVVGQRRQQECVPLVGVVTVIYAAVVPGIGQVQHFWPLGPVGHLRRCSGRRKCRRRRRRRCAVQVHIPFGSNLSQSFCTIWVHENHDDINVYRSR